jgi:peroxin-1
VALADSVDFDALAEKTEGYTGADLQALLYNAHLDVIHEAIAAAEADGTSVRTRTDQLEQKVEYTVLGAKKGGEVRSRAEEADLQRRVCVGRYCPPMTVG